MSTQQTYGQRVRALAEEMAHAAFHDTEYTEGLDPELWEQDREHWVNMHLIIARIATKHMAEAARDFHYAAWTTRALYEHPADGARVGQLEYLLQQKGLIPDHQDNFDPEKQATIIHVSSQLFKPDQEAESNAKD